MSFSRNVGGFFFTKKQGSYQHGMFTFGDNNSHFIWMEFTRIRKRGSGIFWFKFMMIRNGVQEFLVYDSVFLWQKGGRIFFGCTYSFYDLKLIVTKLRLNGHIKLML